MAGKINKKYIYASLLLLIFIVFVGFKIQDLSLPYFWDELGVYAPGALQMVDKGNIGLLPSDLEPLYSRGHPLLFYFCQAFWMNLFGDGVVAAHFFSLVLGVATLAVTYWCVKDLFNKKVALFATMLLAVQPIFYAMSGVVLPEMMLTLFIVPAVWAIIRKKWPIYMVCASCAILTKETAIIVPALALLVVFWDSIKAKNYFFFSSIRKMFYAIVPLIIFTSFLIIQKIQNGWFFFPEHISLIRTDGLSERLLVLLSDLFVAQNRWLLSIFIVIGFAIALSQRPLKIRTMIIIYLFGILSIGFAMFNFYLTRYMLIVMPFITMLAVAGIDQLIRLTVRKYKIALLALICGVSGLLSLQKMKPFAFNDTADMSYTRLLALEKEAIAWVEMQPWCQEKIETNFPIFQALSDTRNGYLSGAPLNVTGNFEEKTNYGVLFYLNNDPIPIWNNQEYTIIKELKASVGTIVIVHFQ